MKKTIIIAGLALLTVICALPVTTMAQDQGQRWIASWATAPQATAPLDSGFAPPFAEGFNDQTIRNIVHTSLGGSAVRVRLTNAYGTQPVTFNAVYVGMSETGTTLVPGSNHALTFLGSSSVTIRAGTEVFSDPLSFKVPSEGNLAISLLLRVRPAHRRSIFLPTRRPTLQLGTF